MHDTAVLVHHVALWAVLGCIDIIAALPQDTKDNTVVDVWLLLVIHTLPPFKKPVEKIFKAKVAANIFTTPVLQTAVQGRSNVLEGYFKNFLALSEQLVRAGGHKQQRVGSALYTALFREFRQSPQQHDVIPIACQYHPIPTRVIFACQ